PSTLGLLLSASAATMVLGQPLLRTRLVRDAPAASVLVSGYAVLGVGLAAYGFTTSVLGFVLATVVAALGDLLLLGRSLTYVADLAPDSARARYLAVYGLSWGLAGVTAPLVGAALMTGFGPALTWTVLGSVCLALAAVQPRVTGSSKQGAMPTLAG
nr:MFS transporter [Nocardioidaceae bacterium]